MIQPTVINLRPNEYSQEFGLKKFLWLRKLKILCCVHMLLMILMEKKLLEHFTKINCKNQIKKNLELKKAINYMLNGKDIIIRLIAG